MVYKMYRFQTSKLTNTNPFQSTTNGTQGCVTELVDKCNNSYSFKRGEATKTWVDLSVHRNSGWYC